MNTVTNSKVMSAPGKVLVGAALVGGMIFGGAAIATGATDSSPDAVTNGVTGSDGVEGQKTAPSPAESTPLDVDIEKPGWPETFVDGMVTTGPHGTTTPADSPGAPAPSAPGSSVVS